MKVTLKSHTNVDDILDYIGKIAGACTAKTGIKDEPRAIRCLKDEHLSVFEHISFTWHIEGISRACTHQLVRHRMASYTQESQRYVKMTDEMVDWFVVPQKVVDTGFETKFKEECKRDLEFYLEMIGKGVPAEDARYILPNATKTNIWVTMNLREFMHFYKMRTDQHAQWEIRDLAKRMAFQVWMEFPDFQRIVDYII